MNKNLISKLAEEAVEQTQLMMIMEYNVFESVLYENFARLVIQECCRLCDERAANIATTRRSNCDFTIKSVLAYGEDTAETLSSDIKKLFGIKEK